MLASLLIKSCQQAELHHQPGRGSVGDIVFQLKVTQKPLHLLLKGIGIISKCKCAIAAPRRNYWEVVSPVSTAEARKWGSCPTRAVSAQFGSTSKGAEGSAYPTDLYRCAVCLRASAAWRSMHLALSCLAATAGIDRLGEWSGFCRGLQQEDLADSRAFETHISTPGRCCLSSPQRANAGRIL